jgi:hypothetical protein
VKRRIRDGRKYNLRRRKIGRIRKTVNGRKRKKRRDSKKRRKSRRCWKRELIGENVGMD